MTTEAPTPSRLRRPSGTRSLTRGTTRLTYVPDGVASLNARLWLPGTTDEDWRRHADFLEEGHLVASVGALLVERDGRALLIDAGVGPLTVGPPLNPFGTLSGGALLENLAALGVDPEAVEAVALTHLHHDHIGWAWHPAPGSEHPAFTNAEYLVSEDEWAHRDEAEGLAPMLQTLAPRVRTVSEGQEIFPGVQVRLAPGHSAGHTAYVIDTGDVRVIAFGDAFHSPVQITHPLWEVGPDHDSQRSATLRRSLVEELAEPGTLGFGVHFADVVFGRVTFEDGRPVWTAVDA